MQSSNKYANITALWVDMNVAIIRDKFDTYVGPFSPDIEIMFHVNELLRINASLSGQYHHVN